MQEQTISGFRISPQQRRVWTLQQQTSIPYSTQGILSLQGNLDTTCLERSVEQIISRHEILRTTFVRPPGMKVPFQVIAEMAVPAWQKHDLRDLHADEQQTRVEELVREDGHRAFDLEKGPLLRLSLLTLTSDSHLLLMSLPTLCADGWTLDTLMHELSRSYDESANGATFDVDDQEDDRLQYADFAEWQHELLEADEEDAEEGRAYWQRQNFSACPPLRLPTEPSQRKPGQDAEKIFAPCNVSIQLEQDLSSQIEQFAQQHNASPAAFLLSCWQTLLHRITGEANILIGNIYDGRTDEELSASPGLFARWLPLAYQIEENLPFGEILWLTNESLREGAEWQDYFSWDEYLETTPAGATSAIGFEFIERSPKCRAGDMTISLVWQQSIFNRFMLQLSCMQMESGLSLTLHYDPVLVEAEDAQRLIEQYATLVRSAMQNPETAIGQLAILSEGERQKLLVTFNETAAAYPQTQCVHEMFEEQVLRAPNRPAIAFDGQQLTYAELNVQANQLAHTLRQHGVTANVQVGLCMDRSLEMVVGLLGILKAGGAYVPLNPDYPEARLAYQLAEIQSPVVLTLTKHLAQLPDFDGDILCLDRDQDLLRGQPETNLAVDTTPDNAVYVIYTSGSTGIPKGVVISHSNLGNYTSFICQRLGLLETAEEQGTAGKQGLQFAMVSTLTADLGNTCLFPCLVSGGCLHVLPYEIAADGGRFASYVSNHAIDVLKIVPSHLNALLASQPAGMNILPNKYLILGGETFSHQLRRRIADSANGCQVINHYGPTETTVGSLTTTVDLYDDSGISSSVPIGRPIANTAIYVLDEDQQPVPIGVPGELYIGGVGVAQGYLNRPDLTEERFVPNPFGQSDKVAKLQSNETPDFATLQLYKTGDLVRYLPDGQIEFLGRVDNQVKIRGFRVELEEIEAILGQHPRMRQAVVLAREDEGPAGGERKQLVAYVVADGESTLNVADLKDYLQSEVPDYMVPSVFVPLDSLPLTPNGKIDRRALPAPDEVETESNRDYVAPNTPNEKELAKIWAEVLGRDRIGIQDNFFADLGGDSILSIQIIARANQAGLHLVPKQIFQYQTIAELATVVGTEKMVHAEQGLVIGSVPLTPIQHWFLDQNFVNAHHWNQAVLLEVQQPLDPILLEQVVHKLAAHHDALRLRFAQTDDGWQQQIVDLDENGMLFSRVNLSDIPETEQVHKIESQAADIQASLNIVDGPLWRVVDFYLGPQKPSRLLIVVHHLAVDGISWRILLEDLQMGYQMLERGGEIAFPAKTTSFKHWAEALTDYAQSEEIENELTHWADKSQQQIWPLPVDLLGGDNTLISEQVVHASLTEEETQALLEEVPEVYHTQINDVLLTALMQAYTQWTGNRSLLVNMEGHGREEISDDVDISRTVGWFTTHVPVLLEAGHTTDLGDILTSIKEQLHAIPNRGIGYGLLRYLSHKADYREQLRLLPHPEIAFNYLGQFDQVLTESSGFDIARESSGPAQDPQGERTYLLYIGGSVIGSQLQLACRYSENLYQRETIVKLAEGMIDALRAIIAHCQSMEEEQYTPSDFALAGLDAQKLDQISDLIAELDEG